LLVQPWAVTAGGLVLALADALEATTPNVLVIDIETSPHLAWSFQTWNTNISPDMIVAPSRVLCFAANWYPAARVDAWSEWDDGKGPMVQALWDLLDRADIVVGYNSDGFDLKHINRELILAGLGPPSPYQTIDLLKTMRHRFKFPSNKLGQVGQSLEIGAKMETGGWKLWQNVLDGDEKARKKFMRYCKQDVRLTADLLATISPWVKSVPHMGLWTGDMTTCYLCGSADLAPAGIAYTKTAKYLRVVCECGAYSKVMTNGDTRPA
jgi:hypothetical protein